MKHKAAQRDIENLMEEVKHTISTLSELIAWADARGDAFCVCRAFGKYCKDKLEKALKPFQGM